MSTRHSSAPPRAGLLLLLLAPCASVAAEEYWGYAYRNIQVTAAGTSAYAVELAHHLVRLDAVVTEALGIKTAYRMPTHIYAVPRAQLVPFLGDHATSSYQISSYDNTILMDNYLGSDARYRYWNAYFGYIGALLLSDGSLRRPYWYRVGVPEVFADAVFEGNRVKTGSVSSGVHMALLGGALIPMRTFLALTKSQVESRGERYRALYDAESWYVARQIFVEQRHRSEFMQYLALMDQGTSEPDAFAGSFKTTYEELDRELVEARVTPAHVYLMQAPGEAAGDRGTAQRLSAAEVKGRLALLSLGHRRGPDALQLAREALQAEPTNESALRALARAQFARGAYNDALAAVDSLAAHGSSPVALADSAAVLAGLARAVADGQATLPVDAATLKQRARDAYQRAIAADGEDRRSRDALAALDR